MASDRMEIYFQHYAEVIAQAQSNEATCTIVEIRGQDCLYELSDGADTWQGWWHEGESVNDIKWKDA